MSPGGVQEVGNVGTRSVMSKPRLLIFFTDSTDSTDLGGVVNLGAVTGLPSLLGGSRRTAILGAVDSVKSVITYG